MHRIQHYLGMLFLLTLIFTQSLVYVAVTAQTDADLSRDGTRAGTLQVVFIEPVAGQNIQIGQTVHLRAQLTQSGASTYSAVFLVVKTVSTGQELNFETSLQSDGSWLASSVWDTNQWLAGAYQLRATTKIYGAGGTVVSSYNSATQNINLITPTNGDIVPNNNASSTDTLVASFRQPQAGSTITVDKSNVAPVRVELAINQNTAIIIHRVSSDLYYQANSTQEFSLLQGNIELNLVANTTNTSTLSYAGTLSPANYQAGNYKLRAKTDFSLASATSTSQTMDLSSVNFVVALTATEPPFSVKFISPIINQKLSSDSKVLVEVELSKKLSTGHSLKAYLIERTLAQSPVLANYQNKVINLTNSDTNKPLIFKSSADLIAYTVGDYSLLVYDMTATSQSLLGSLNLSIVPATQIIFLTSPVSGSVVRENFIYLVVRTSILANALTMELVNTINPAIGTGAIQISKTDGTNWNHNVVLDNSFIDGSYNLVVEAQIPGQDNAGSLQTKETTFSLILSRLTAEEPDFNNISFVLNDITSGSAGNIQSNLSEAADLSSVSNIKSGQAYFVLRDSIDKKEVLRLTQAGISAISGATGTALRYKYTAVLDTTTLSNANYYLSGELYYNNKLVATTSERLISIYNPGVTGGQTLGIDFFLQLQLALRAIRNEAGSSNNLVIYLSSNAQPQPDPLKLALLDNNSTTIASINFFPVDPNLTDGLGVTPINKVQTPQTYRGTIARDLVYKGGDSLTLRLAYLDGNGTVMVTSNDLTLAVKDGLVQIEADTYNPQTENKQEQNSKKSITASKHSGFAIGLFATCSDVSIKQDQSCRAFKAMIAGTVNIRCQEQSIFDAAACEDYLNKLVVDLECQGQNIVDREKCKDYLLEKYGNNIECRLSDQIACTGVLRNQYINRLVVNKKDSTLVAEAVESLIGQTISLKQLGNRLTAGGSNVSELPLKPADDTNVLVAGSRAEVVLEAADRLTTVNKAVLLVDSDSDGLPNDLEKYYGTDINKADTDNDGYSDSTEIKNGYNPAGQGILQTERTSLDKVILSGLTLEQPKISSGPIDNEFAVEDIANENGNIKFSGIGRANTWVNIYLYSGLPLVMNTMTDANGRWEYTMRQSLADGNHRAFVVVSDDTGTIIKQSSPTSFLAKDGLAIVASQYFKEVASDQATNNWFWYYIIGGAVLSLGLIILVVYLAVRRRNSLNF